MTRYLGTVSLVLDWTQVSELVELFYGEWYRQTVKRMKHFVFFSCEVTVRVVFADVVDVEDCRCPIPDGEICGLRGEPDESPFCI